MKKSDLIKSTLVRLGFIEIKCKSGKYDCYSHPDQGGIWYFVGSHGGFRRSLGPKPAVSKSNGIPDSVLKNMVKKSLQM